jgi:hypothetical protein
LFAARDVDADAVAWGNPTEAIRQLDRLIFLLDGPFGRDVVARGWAGKPTVEHLKESVRAWGEHPDAFFANVHVEVIGWKSVSSLPFSWHRDTYFVSTSVRYRF